MREVTLRTLSLCNFKGERQRTTAFNADVTTISGGNGLGKSRHFDAFIWLLFGKDAKDRKDYEIKTRVNGKELHQCECSVTGVIDVDGTEIRLKRSLVEDWVKPRGQVEQVFKGNHTECWWNDVPVNVSEYDKRIKEIMDASLFKMITNPAFFVGMKWQLQREQLFQLAGAVTDAEIATSRPEFAALMDRISGKSLADYKKEIGARKKRLNEELRQIQPRIDQTHRMMPEAEDFTAIERELARVDGEIAGIDRSLTDITAGLRERYEREQAKQRRINELRLEAQRIVNEARRKREEEHYQANARRRELERAIQSREVEIETLRQETRHLHLSVGQWRREVDTLKVEQECLRKEWFEENGREYAGETTCPHCGQPLPEAMIAKAKEMHDEAIMRRKGEITAKGKALGGRVRELEEMIAKHLRTIDANREAVATMSDEQAKAREELDRTPLVETVDVRPEEIPAYVAKTREIEEIQATVLTEGEEVDNTDLMTRKGEWQSRHDDLSARLAKRGEIERCQREIAHLEAHGKEVAQQIADIERDEYTVEQFTRTKIEECEKRINAKFRLVTFRLFDYTIEGNPVETCVALIDGVPYGGANTAGQVNAGLDIINALCEFYGVRAPIFIDNRESVNEIIPIESQIINLVVTNDNKLTIQ